MAATIGLTRMLDASPAARREWANGTPPQFIGYVSTMGDMPWDTASEVEIDGGWDRSKVCPKHFVTLARNGTCGDCE